MESIIPTAFDLSPGAILFDRYRILSRIGKGGMGVVLCAEQLSTQRRVAIKILLPQFASTEEARARFVREAEVSQKIESDHVTQVIDVGTFPEGTPFIVMEYLDGEDLSKHLRDGNVYSLNDAIDFIVQAATGLAEAHLHGIVHRDVKPANFVLIRNSQGGAHIKLLDFGISKLMGDEGMAGLSLTKTSAVLGSGLYMSPEQMRSPKSVDARTDVYALGICMYELLTGSFPFVADTFAELAVKVNLEAPEPIHTYRKDIPAALAKVLERAYAQRASQRYPTVTAFAGELRPFALHATQAKIDTLLASETHFTLSQSAGSLLPSLSPPAATPKRSSSPVLVGVVSFVLLACVAVAGLAWLRASTKQRDAEAAALVDLKPHADPVSTPGMLPSATSSVPPGSATVPSIAPSASSSSSPPKEPLGQNPKSSGKPPPVPCADRVDPVTLLKIPCGL